MQIVTMHDTDCTNTNQDSALRPGFWNKFFDLTCHHFFIQTRNTWCRLSLSSIVFCHLATALLVWWCVCLYASCVSVYKCILCVCMYAGHIYICVCVCFFMSVCGMCFFMNVCVCGRCCCNLGGLRHRLAMCHFLWTIWLILNCERHTTVVRFAIFAYALDLKGKHLHMRLGTTTTTLLRC